MRILAIGAHADDVELGCGGTLLRWGEQNDHQIFVYTATDSAYGNPDGTEVRSASDAEREARKAAKKMNAELILGPFKCLELEFAEPLNAALVKQIKRIEPDVVLTHWDGDSHPDHKNLALASLHACRRVPTVLLYRSNTYAGATAFDGRYYVDITLTLDAKLDLIETFESEYSRTNGAWRDTVRDIAAVRGRECVCRFAESFQPVRVTV